MTDDLGAAGVWLVIAAMAAVTYLTRIGGFIVMGYVPLTRRVRAFLQALPGAVVVAIVLPIVVKDGGPAVLAVVVALGGDGLAQERSRGRRSAASPPRRWRGRFWSERSRCLCKTASLRSANCSRRPRAAR